MRQVLITRQAEEDLLAIWRFVADSSVRSADRLVGELQRKADSLATMPLRGHVNPLLPRGFRTLSHRNFWLLIYTIGDETVVVVRIVGGNQDLSQLQL